MSPLYRRQSEYGSDVNYMRTDARLLHDCTPSSGDTAAQETSSIKASLFVNSHDRDICYHSILRESRCAHLISDEHWRLEICRDAYEVVKLFAIASKARRPVRHDTLPLSRSHFIDPLDQTEKFRNEACERTFPAQIGLAALAELAFFAF